jgi:hypothetical protein
MRRRARGCGKSTLYSYLAVQQKLCLGLALVLGCDYIPGGVCGVGREAVVSRPYCTVYPIAVQQKHCLGLALVLGCDYIPGGVCGVGREAVVSRPYLLYILYGSCSTEALSGREMDWFKNLSSFLFLLQQNLSLLPSYEILKVFSQTDFANLCEQGFSSLAWEDC